MNVPSGPQNSLPITGYPGALVAVQGYVAEGGEGGYERATEVEGFYRVGEETEGLEGGEGRGGLGDTEEGTGGGGGLGRGWKGGVWE